MKIYTRTGDKGTTALVGGRRISKASLRIEAYGTLDELTAHLGFLASTHFSLQGDIQTQLCEIISRVMDCSAIVASEDETLEKLPKITQKHCQELENWCDELLQDLPQLRHFTLPIGSGEMSYAHVCRTVARRSERAMVRVVDGGETISQWALTYINRLSDYLYALSRNIAHNSGTEDVLWRENRD